MSNQMQTTETKEIAKPADAVGLRGLLSRDAVKQRFQDVLGKDAAMFSAGLLTVYNGSQQLQKCTPKSILNAAFQAATFKLPLTGGLGYAAIVPYGNQAGFQLMTRGFLQLAHRSGQYKKINIAHVHEGELVSFNEFTGEVTLDATKKTSNKVIGYFFFFELLTGYRHEAFWSVEKCQAHGKRYSKSYANPKGLWKTNPEAMEMKTVLKNELAKWGPLSVDPVMQQAVKLDQAVIGDDGKPSYIDSTVEDPESEEVIPDPVPADAKSESEEVESETGEVEEAIVVFGSTATTEIAGEKAYIGKTEDGTKFYTRHEKMAKSIKAFAKESVKVKVRFLRENGIAWIDSIEAVG